MTRRRLRIFSTVAAALAAILAASGCGTATIEDAVPVSATAQPQAATPAGGQAAAATAQPAAAAAPQQPAAPFKRPGDYPNLNVIPQPAATQITAAEKDADTTLLRSIRDQQQAQGADDDSTSSAEELRRLRQTHAAEALKAIEGE